MRSGNEVLDPTLIRSQMREQETFPRATNQERYTLSFATKPSINDKVHHSFQSLCGCSTECFRVLLQVMKEFVQICSVCRVPNKGGHRPRVYQGAVDLDSPTCGVKSDR